ncbi:NADH dehydrogenase [ubiquinone] 1 subunit C1, mitochondrial-like [Neomonachus schauinslandi]|uniref:NADH dehydrogenase [ubiquinone] 1 subunit C1, mitochondrial n=1 Tax=Neomonachus schauinslandi TaxID=29088 RepID=A0A8M1MAJ1_NEOSC|nr:NADH dehydrogenase [ubiquinone] 1 subunit C1, mitochondrial-like [Neomonachus schauinslandi]
MENDDYGTVRGNQGIMFSLPFSIIPCDTCTRYTSQLGPGLQNNLAPARLPSGSSARSKFYIREAPRDRPDWLKVGLTLGTSVFLWIYLIKQHNDDVLGYKRRNGLE